MIAAARSRKLNVEPEMRKTVVCGVSEVDTVHLYSKQVSTFGVIPQGATGVVSKY